MDKFKTFQEFLATQSVQVSIWSFMLDLILAALLGFILSKIYIKYGSSLSNRKMFAGNFILMTMTTMLVISVVKSSLALSLGLVGALSIVRFRAAIKEPEELAYLFITIAIGLGLGGDQRLITVAAFTIMVGIIWLRNFLNKSEENQNLYLTVSSHNPKKIELKNIIDVLNKTCSAVKLKRFDETKDVLEASFLVEFDNIEQLNRSKSELQALNDSVKITFLENQGIV